MFNHVNNWKVEILSLVVTTLGLFLFKNGIFGIVGEFVGVVMFFVAITYNENINPKGFTKS